MYTKRTRLLGAWCFHQALTTYAVHMWNLLPPGQQAIQRLHQLPTPFIHAWSKSKHVVSQSNGTHPPGQRVGQDIHPLQQRLEQLCRRVAGSTRVVEKCLRG